MATNDTVLATIHNKAIPTIDVIIETQQLFNIDTFVMNLVRIIIYEFAPIWRCPAKLVRSGCINSGHWALVIADSYSHAHDLGYRDLTPSGLPLIVVPYEKEIIAPTLKELYNFLADPYANTIIAHSTGDFYALDVTSAVGENDFLYPAWFNEHATDKQYSHLNTVLAPFTAAKGRHRVTMSSRKGLWTPLDNSDNLSARWHRNLRNNKKREKTALAGSVSEVDLNLNLVGPV